MNIFDFPFWKDFLSNALATFLGALVGIPIALWISRYQAKIEEKERKLKILRLLKHELLMNFGKLTRWDTSVNPISITSELCIFLKTEYWKAFSDGGELQWIKDPELLSMIAEAYNFIRMIVELSNRYLDIEQARNTALNENALSHIWGLLKDGVEHAKSEITSALQQIERAEKK